MSSFFTPKLRQEGFAPPASPGPSPPAPAFDAANMFFAHHMFPHQQQHQQQHPDPPRVDFGDELAAMLVAPRAPSPPHHHHPPHNPFDTNSTAPYRHPHAPHNIFDVGAPPAPFPPHFSLPEHHSGHPYASYPDFAERRRSRSRSKPPPPAPPGGRGRIPKKRASVSSAHSPSPGRPHAILIPPPGSPLALHMHAQTAPSAWFAADSPFSLPTPDSVGVSHFGASPRSASAKESPPPQDAASKQAALASEKRRRRRESHNAVERRRRDNINEKISELATLIPECMLDPSAGADGLDGFAGVPHADEDGDRKDAAGAVKANKGMILRKSVEYIRYLQQLVNAQATRNRELEAQLAHGPDDGMRGLVLGMEDDAALGMGLGLESPPAAPESQSPPAAPRGRPRGVRVKRESEGEGEGEEGEEEDDADADASEEEKRMEE